MNSFVKDDAMMNNKKILLKKASTHQLEIITEETPKITKITQDMIDIAEVRFNHFQVKVLIKLTGEL